MGAALALMIAAAPAMADEHGDESESWLPSLQTATPEEGFDLAVTMARRGVTTTQPEIDTLMELRPNYAHDPQSLIHVSQVIADYFATIAAANDYWRD